MLQKLESPEIMQHRPYQSFRFTTFPKTQLVLFSRRIDESNRRIKSTKVWRLLLVSQNLFWQLVCFVPRSLPKPEKKRRFWLLFSLNFPLCRRKRAFKLDWHALPSAGIPVGHVGSPRRAVPAQQPGRWRAYPAPGQHQQNHQGIGSSGIPSCWWTKFR